MVGTIFSMKTMNGKFESFQLIQYTYLFWFYKIALTNISSIANV